MCIRDSYTGAFVAEMQAFADAVINDKETPVTGEDGLYPVLIDVYKRQARTR